VVLVALVVRAATMALVSPQEKVGRVVLVVSPELTLMQALLARRELTEMMA